MDETNQDILAHQLTGGSGDNSKVKHVEFQSKSFKLEKDISLETPRINLQIQQRVKQKTTLYILGKFQPNLLH